MAGVLLGATLAGSRRKSVVPLISLGEPYACKKEYRHPE
jgi:hypothetical protein